MVSHLNYRDYPLSRAGASIIGLLTWNYNLANVLHWLFKRVPNVFNIKSKARIITCSINRADYNLLLKSYFPDDEFHYLDMSNGMPGRVKCFRMIKSILLSLYFSVFKVRGKLRDRLIIAAVVAFAVRVIDELEENQITCKEYYAFNSSFLLESFLCFYFKKRSIPSYSFQHGMYFNFTGNNKPYDVINYENICSDYFLCWGEYTKNEIQHLIPCDVVIKIIGNQLLNSITACKQREQEDTIYVLLPRDIYWNQSVALLNIISDLNLKMKVVVRPHPSISDRLSLLIQEHKGMIIDVNPDLVSMLRDNCFHAVISFNSTAIFQAIAFNQKVVCFDNNSEFDISMFNSFGTGEELMHLLSMGEYYEHNVSYYFGQKSLTSSN